MSKGGHRLKKHAREALAAIRLALPPGWRVTLSFSNTHYKFALHDRRQQFRGFVIIGCTPRCDHHEVQMARADARRIVRSAA